MPDETAVHGKRLRDLEAFAFRTRHALTECSEQLAAVREQQRTAFWNIGSKATSAPGDRAIEQRLNTIEQVLFALARAQGIAPAATE